MSGTGKANLKKISETLDCDYSHVRRVVSTRKNTTELNKNILKMHSENVKQELIEVCESIKYQAIIDIVPIESTTK